MLKQKLIPLAGAMLMLVSCGGSKPPIEININKQSEANALLSDSFELKRGKKYSYLIDYNSLGETFEDSSDGGRILTAKWNEPPLISDFIDTNKDFSITYNDKKLSRFDGELDTWEEAVNDKSEAVNNTFMYCVIDDKSLKSGPVISFCHYEQKKTDKITITFTCKDNFDGVIACFIQSLTL